MASEKRASGRGRRVRVQVGDVQVSLRLASEPAGPNALPVAEWLPFSATEARVLAYLLRRRAASREEIAKDLDESIDGRLRGILATLVARKVLLVTGDGYAVNAPAGRKGELLGWLGTEEGTAESGSP